MPKTMYSGRSWRLRRRSRWPLLALERLEDRTLLSGDTLPITTALSFTDLPKVLVQSAHAAGFLATPNEVDLYKIRLHSGDRVTAAVSAQTSGSSLQSLLRVFDAQGDQVALDDQEGGDPHLTFQAATTGVYSIGVSAAGDDAYDPTTGSNRQGGSATGQYALDLYLTANAPLQSDLAGASFRLNEQAAAWGDANPITGAFTVDNRGGAAAERFSVEVVLSSNPRFDGFSPRQVLTPIFQAGPPTILAADSSYTDHFSVQLPPSAPAGFAASGPVYVGLLIVPGANDSGQYDKSGVHRGEDWESLTIVTPASPGATNLSVVDANLNTRVDGTLLSPNQVDVYPFTVTNALGSGRLTVEVTATGSTLLPRLTLSRPDGQVLIQSDDGSIEQHLQSGTYILTVSTRPGSTSYRLTSEFVQASDPFDTIPAGNIPDAVAVADVNGDGIPDIVITNDGSDNVSVLLGVGDGTFQPQKTFAVGSLPDSVVVADLNGDGLPDLVVANSGDNTVSVLLGNGDGTFQPQRTLDVGASQFAVAVADLNDDGIPDVIVVKSNNTVGVLLGNSDGSFGPAITSVVGIGADCLAVADVNGDGKPDLIVGNAGTVTKPGDTVSLLLGNGDGTFRRQQTIKVGHGPAAVAVKDVNGDGRPDLLVVNQDDNDVSVLLGNGDGTFRPQRTFAVGYGPISLAVADINGDGKLDLIIANSTASTVSVLLGKGDGSFEPQVATYVNGADSIVVADVTGDGKPDLVTDTPSVFTGTGDGSFQTQPEFNVGTNPESIAVADVNGDGKPDLVIANSSDNTVSVLLGNGDGTFQPQEVFPVGNGPTAVAVADINGDGRPDLIVVNNKDNTVGVLLGNGDGTFQSQHTFPVGIEPDAVAVANLNGDGRLDLVVANYGSNSVSVLLGNGNGTFQPQKNFAVGLHPDDVAVADLNGDGKPDLVAANVGNIYHYKPGHTLSVLLGNGNGTFQPQRTVTVGLGPDAVAVADLNGDGKPDLIVTDDGSSDYYHKPQTVSVLLGKGDGTFQPQQTIATGYGPSSVAVADVNGDGKPDLVVADGGVNFYPGSKVSMLLGKGDGTFQPQQTFATGYGPSSVVVADVNGDGRPDIVTANRYDNTVSVLLGNGDGTFSASTPTNGVGLRNTPYLADFNGDGIPDSAILGSGGNILFRNGLEDTENQFASPVILNDKAMIGENRPARDLTVLKTPTGWAIATADSGYDETLSSADHFINTVSLYTVASDGSVSRTTAFSSPFLPTRIAAADLTGNGLYDIVVADSLDDCVQVAFQQLDGSFTSPLTLAVGLAPSDITFADENGDGLLDIAVSNQASGTVTVLLNDDAHSFTTVEIFRAGTGLSDVMQGTKGATVYSLDQSVSLIAGNFTGAGRNDLLVVNRGTDSFTVLPNDSNSGFGNPQAALTTSTSDGLSINDQGGPVVAGSFNGLNNPLDVAILMEDIDQVWIYTGDDKGHFTHTFSIVAGTDATGLSVFPDAQTNFLDLLVGNQFGDILRLQGNGNGTFQSPPPISGTRVTVDVRQVNDQTQVLLANQEKNQVLVETRVTDGPAFAPIQTVAAANATTPFAPSDASWYALDQNNTALDAVVVGSGSNSLQIYRFDPTANRYVPTEYPAGTDPVSVTIADVNRDGIPDMLVVNKGSNDVSVLFGSYAGGKWIAIAGPRLKSGGDGPIAVNLVPDAKSLGGYDLAVTNGQSGTIAVLPGRGQGFFDDRTPQIINLGTPIAQPPSFNSGGLGVAVTDAGQLLRFDLNDLAAGASVVFGSADQDVLAAEELDNGEVAAALANGTVEMLRPDANGLETTQVLTPLTGVPQSPSALDVLETASALQVLVTSAGQDTIFVFGFEPTVSGPATQTPSLPAPTPLPTPTVEASALEEGLVVVVTLAAPSLGEGAVTGAFILPAPAAVVRVGGDADLQFQEGGGSVDGVVDVEAGVPDFRPGLRNALRQLELYQPPLEQHPGDPLARQVGPDPSEDRAAALVLLWESPFLTTPSDTSLGLRDLGESWVPATPLAEEVDAPEWTLAVEAVVSESSRWQLDASVRNGHADGTTAPIPLCDDETVTRWTEVCDLPSTITSTTECHKDKRALIGGLLIALAQIGLEGWSRLREPDWPGQRIALRKPKRKQR